MTRKSPNSVGSRRFSAVLLASLILSLLPFASVSAAIAVTTPGTASVSSDTFTSGSTALPSIVVTEDGAGQLTAAGTIILNAPAGYDFDTSGADPTPPSTGGNGLTASFTSRTASLITYTIGAASTSASSLTLGGIRVKADAGTPMAAAGSITNTGTTGPGGNWGTLTQVPGAAILTFQVAPSPTTLTAGVDFTTSPTVRSQDLYGNLRTGDSITLATVPATTGLGCTANPVTTAAGNAVFASCQIDTAGSFVLRASGAGASVDFSTAITVNPGTATKLVFTTQPARGTPTVAFAGQPVVVIQDALNNIVTTASASVTLAIGTNPGGGGTTLLCTTNPLTTTSGVASFGACRINNVGVGYTLTANDGGSLTDPTSAAFDVADRVVFTTQPSGAVAATAFTTQPVVAVRAGTTNTAVNDSGTSVTLSLSGGPAGAALVCNSNPVTVSAGVATFSGCRIDKVGSYTLVASASGLGTVTSTSLTVVAGPAIKLGFTAQPNAGVTAQAFPIQPVVAVQDAGANTVLSGTNSTATVTLSLGAGAPTGAVLTCTGGLSKAAVAGVATFAGCSINAAGTYTLIASATGLTAATGTSFIVTAPVATITLTNSASVITWGGAIALNIQFGTNGGNKAFVLEGARDGVNFVTIANLTTNASGFATFPYTPVSNLYYRVRFTGTLDLGAANSNTTRTVVRQIALLRPTNSGATKSITRNTSVKFTTTVRPSRPELPAAKVTFVFYKRIGGAWIFVAKRDVYIDSLGLASWTWKFTSVGSWYVRSIANPTPYNANSVWSQLEFYNVR